MMRLPTLCMLFILYVHACITIMIVVASRHIFTVIMVINTCTCMNDTPFPIYTFNDKSVTCVYYDLYILLLHEHISWR